MPSSINSRARRILTVRKLERLRAFPPLRFSQPTLTYCTRIVNQKNFFIFRPRLDECSAQSSERLRTTLKINEGYRLPKEEIRRGNEITPKSSTGILQKQSLAYSRQQITESITRCKSGSKSHPPSPQPLTAPPNAVSRFRYFNLSQKIRPFRRRSFRSKKISSCLSKCVLPPPPGGRSDGRGQRQQ